MSTKSTNTRAIEALAAELEAAGLDRAIAKKEAARRLAIGRDEDTAPTTAEVIKRRTKKGGK